jgi:hypothetical protein
LNRPEPRLTAQAWEEVASAAEYYEAQQPGLGGAFLDELDGATAFIRENPLLATLVDEPVRRVLLRRFPFGVFFDPGTGGEPDVVVAVIDLRRDPDVIRQTYKR